VNNPSSLTRSASCVIVGAGQAGAHVAMSLRQLDYAGRILLIGDEAFPPYERPPLSKEILVGSKSAEECLVRAPEFFADRGIALAPSAAVVSIDRERRLVRLSDDSSVEYETLVIATGCRPRQLNPSLGHAAGVVYLRKLDDALRLKDRLLPGRRLTIVGAGYIGLEVAAAATALGCKVTVIDSASTAMTRVLPIAISRRILDVHEDAGVQFLFGRQLASIERNGEAIVLRFADETALHADVVLVAVGVTPNDRIAADAGLTVADGVVVDQFSRSSDPSIYAVGDVSKRFHPLYGRHIRLESWQNAQNQSISAAGHICGAMQAYAELPWFWSNQFHLNVQMVGMPSHDHRVVFREYGNGSFVAFCLDQDRLAATVAVNRPRDIGESRRLIANAGRLDVEKLRDAAVPLRSAVMRTEVPLEQGSP
jgi:3-phenylpropionate/trans-cinnamate dioxygenase ferredoxin reductase component